MEKPGEKVDIGNKKKVNNETGGQTEYEDEEENDLANPWLKNSSAKIKKRKPIVEQNEDELNSKKKKQTTIEELDIEDVLSVPEHIINCNCPRLFYCFVQFSNLIYCLKQIRCFLTKRLWLKKLSLA